VDGGTRSACDAALCDTDIPWGVSTSVAKGTTISDDDGADDDDAGADGDEFSSLTAEPETSQCGIGSRDRR
jgi:hypothetical protein